MPAYACGAVCACGATCVCPIAHAHLGKGKEQPATERLGSQPPAHVSIVSAHPLASADGKSAQAGCLGCAVSDDHASVLHGGALHAPVWECRGLRTHVAPHPGEPATPCASGVEPPACAARRTRLARLQARLQTVLSHPAAAHSCTLVRPPAAPSPQRLAAMTVSLLCPRTLPAALYLMLAIAFAATGLAYMAAHEVRACWESACSVPVAAVW